MRFNDKLEGTRENPQQSNKPTAVTAQSALQFSSARFTAHISKLFFKKDISFSLIAFNNLNKLPAK